MSYSSQLRNLHFYHVPHRFKPTEITALYITHTLRAFAFSLIGIYVPIFIFQLNSLPMLSGDILLEQFRWILIYFLIRHLVFLLSLLSFTNVVLRILGFRKSILLSQVLGVVFAVSLLQSQVAWVWLLVAAVFDGLSMFFYWVPYHIFFVQKANKKGSHFGSATGTRFFLFRTMNALGPLVGGFTIALFGFGTLFVMSGVLAIAAVIPILFDVTEGFHHKHDVYKIMEKHALKRERFHTSLAFVGESLDSVIAMVFIPILMYVLLENFTSIGVLSGISMFLSAIAVLLLGKYTDKGNGRVIQKIGALCSATFYTIRIFLQSAFGLYLVDITDRVTNAAYALPFASKIYEEAKQHGEIEYILYHELVLHPAILITICMCLVLLPILPSWQWIFGLGALGVIMTHLIFFEGRRNKLTEKIIKAVR